MQMPLETKAPKPPLRTSLRRNRILYLSFITFLSVISLVLIFPAGVSAHTSLLRTDPANDAFLRAAPRQVRLWFSTVLSPEFSTAVIENTAHEYVNIHDAYLSPGDDREMDIPLPSRLSPGVYTVVWRAVSDSDGLVVEGAYSFAIMHPYGLHILNWKSCVGVLVLICLGLGILQEVQVSFAHMKTPSALILSMQQATKSALTTFHSDMRTSDKQFDVVLDISTIGCCSSLFTMSVSDANTGERAAHISVVLYTTMLDMHMGTDAVNVQPEGEGHFKSQIDLSMGGLWQVCIAIQTTDHKSHAACVKVLIPY